MNSIFWYDFETTGINPRTDRAIQVAGVRTNEGLEIIDEPINFYSQLSADILPSPKACLVTGIEPRTLMEQGLSESDFIARLRQELIQPGTCLAGFNNLRFDDEVTRYSFYRNFHDPYAHEWQGGNSRWDIIDVLRCAYALRPEGIQWPVDENGQTSLRLELLTAINGIEHQNAHDALSDVLATIAMAKLVKQAQPQLYAYLYGLRNKHQVQSRIKLFQPILHVSGRFSSARHYLAPVLPIAWHPSNKNAVIVCDLHGDIHPLLSLSAEQIKEDLYTSHHELNAKGKAAIPIKLLHINKCPVVAPMNVLRLEDKQRLAWNDELWQQNLATLLAAKDTVEGKVKSVFLNENDWPVTVDPEQQLYGSFIDQRNRELCQQVHTAQPEELLKLARAFSDERLPTLLVRYHARNFPELLNKKQMERWLQFCKERLTDEGKGAPRTLAGFFEEVNELSAEEQKNTVVSNWVDYAHQLKSYLNIKL